jgi:excisionase family DNA binding protein
MQAKRKRVNGIPDILNVLVDSSASLPAVPGIVWKTHKRASADGKVEEVSTPYLRVRYTNANGHRRVILHPAKGLSPHSVEEERKRIKDALEAERSARRPSAVEKTLSQITPEQVVADAVAKRVKAQIAPLKSELASLRRANIAPPESPKEPITLTFREAASLSRLPESRLREAAKSGHLPAIKMGRVTIVRRADVLQYVEQLFSSAASSNAAPANEAEAANPSTDRVAELLKAVAEYARRIAEAKRLAKLHKTGDWEGKVSASFRDLLPYVVERLLSDAPSALAYEQVGRNELRVSGRHLRRILAKYAGSTGKAEDKN